MSNCEIENLLAESRIGRLCMADAAGRRRFQREAQTASSLNHPHILKLFDFGQQGDLLYLVMELITGGSLADLIRKGSLPLEQASRLLEQIASALDYAHEQGIIHRAKVALGQQPFAHQVGLVVVNIAPIQV